MVQSLNVHAFLFFYLSFASKQAVSKQRASKPTKRTTEQTKATENMLVCFHLITFLENVQSCLVDAFLVVNYTAQHSMCVGVSDGQRTRDRARCNYNQTIQTPS